jgi:hypothetical protein
MQKILQNKILTYIDNYRRRGGISAANVRRRTSARKSRLVPNAQMSLNGLGPSPGD